MRRIAAVLAAGVLLMTSGCGSGPSDLAATAKDTPAPLTAPLTVTTTSGTLRGTASGSVRKFLGVRYAQPPTGDGRWSPPRPLPAPAHSTRGATPVDATKPGARCPQTAGAPTHLPGSTDEDCLFVNVTTPRDLRPGERLPVLVWWHGGGLTSGSGNDYGPERIVTRGRVVVVTVNYRLGAFGYLGLPGLKGSGSFGFADQIAAARWAKENARAFGGDPGNLTVFGESAGGMSACALLTSPEARGLMDKVVIMSGSCLVTWPAGTLYPKSPAQDPYIPLAQVRTLGAKAAQRLGCRGADTLSCMRRKPVAELLKLDVNVANRIAYGASPLPADPAQSLRTGGFARIPVLAGGTRDEARSFVAALLHEDPRAVTAANYPGLIRTSFGSHAPAVAARYPLKDYPSPGVAWATVVTDATWACPTLTAQRALAAHTRVYGYEFADPHAPNVLGVTVPSVPLGAGHAGDLPYLFDLGGRNLLTTPEQRTLATRMIDYLTTFARNGRPTAPNSPDAPRATPSSSTALRLAPGRLGPVNLSEEHHCPFWERVGRR
ncbi:carboxylesterase/lipase family protein [Streptomyces sp. NPDC088554]|uniref:carboxylesterase/lipase family protein n=1 Tax=Streptomyces sp. NPDC088554 TaxID=3365865 RepID=UPI00381CD95F